MYTARMLATHFIKGERTLLKLVDDVYVDCNMGLVRSRLCIITVKWNESYATARDLCVVFIVVFLIIGINMSLFKLSLTH